MNIFEWDEETPVTANNLNEMQNTINENIKDIYSTSEIRTNKISSNNKPIYRKVFNNISYSTAQTETATGITNVATITDISGTINGRPINFQLDTYYISTWVDYSNNSLNIYTRCSAVYQGIGRVILEYTKTTD